jgi:effector-binding domain-containing protein
MKKLGLVVFSALILLLVYIYAFHPSPVTVSYTISLHSNAASMGRYLDKKTNWDRWWSISDNGYSYSTGRKFPLLKELFVNHNGIRRLSTLLIRPVAGKQDSIDIVWQLDIDPSTYNPIKRINNYQEANVIKNNVSKILDSLKNFFQKENTYGIAIREATITDSILLVTRKISDMYPSTDSVYQLFDKLKSVISVNKTKQTGNPLLNVTQLGNGQFQVTAALPIDRNLTSGKDFQTKKMLNGLFLVVEIKGGIYSIENSLRELQNYFLDHNRTMMAMPFQILITDRREEKDSSKWITQIYVPTY